MVTPEKPAEGPESIGDSEDWRTLYFKERAENEKLRLHLIMLQVENENLTRALTNRERALAIAELLPRKDQGKT